MSLNEQFKQFEIYFNDFYGKEGIYSSGRHIGKSELLNAIGTIEADTGETFQGDSIGRELVRDLIFTEAEIDEMYAS